MSSCNRLYLFLSIMGALPAILCSILILVVLMMLEKISVSYTLLLILFIIIVGLIPVLIDYFFKSQLGSYIADCSAAANSKMAQERRGMANMQGVGLPQQEMMRRQVSTRETIAGQDPYRNPMMPQMMDEEDMIFNQNIGMY